MKKKQQITIQKNLQSGKTHIGTTKKEVAHPSSHRAIPERVNQKSSKKILSQQKVNIQKPSHSKNSNKQSRPIVSSITKNEKSKSKQKGQSVKGSKKSIKRHHSQDQNSVASGRKKNIYTDNRIQNKNKVKKSKKFTDQSSQSDNNQHHQYSLVSIGQSIKSKQSFQRFDVDYLVRQIEQAEFSNLHKLKLHVLNFIFKNRIIKDEQFDRLYELMAQKFPEKQEIFRSILFQIVSSLDN